MINIFCHLCHNSETINGTDLKFSQSLKVFPSALYAKFQPPEPLLVGFRVLRLRYTPKLWIDSFCKVLYTFEFASSESVLQNRKQPKVTRCEVGAVGRVGQNFDWLLLNSLSCGPWFMGGSVVMKKQGARGSNCWPLLINGVFDLWQYILKIVCRGHCSIFW